jgi:hypothetical protein
MDGAPATPCPRPFVRRVFEFSRLEQQLLALAYEQLLPIIPPPRRPRRQPAVCLLAGRCAGQPSFQEEQDLETP